MDDLISRQEVIDLLKQMRKDGNMVPWEGKDVFARIRKLPPAQLSTNLAEVGTDLISRQAALDAFNYVGEYNLILYQSIKNMPSAEPKIILCKDCKHYWIHKCMDSMPIERCDLEQTFYDPGRDFCSLAERREDG